MTPDEFSEIKRKAAEYERIQVSINELEKMRNDLKRTRQPGDQNALSCGLYAGHFIFEFQADVRPLCDIKKRLGEDKYGFGSVLYAAMLAALDEKIKELKNKQKEL